MNRNKQELVKLGRTLFPTRKYWPIEELEINNLPLYWNKEWLQERLRSVGSSYLLASKWGYPWGEIKRLARHFGIPLPDHKAWVGKYFLLEKEAIKKVDERRRPHQSRNRWIIEALKAYYRSQDIKDEGFQKKRTYN